MTRPLDPAKLRRKLIDVWGEDEGDVDALFEGCELEQLELAGPPPAPPADEDTNVRIPLAFL